MTSSAFQNAIRKIKGTSLILKLPVIKDFVPPIPGAQLDQSMVPGSRTTRPLWFDGRFLASADLEREQNCFLQKQASLGRASGFGVLHGLMVEQGLVNGKPAPETVIVRAGDGITPSGELVMIPTDLTIQLSDLSKEENLSVQFGVSQDPQQPPRTRTGIYVIALRPVQFTANPITSYPPTLQAPRVTHDGDIVEATAVSLVEYPNPVNNYDASLQQAALAREIFLTPDSGTPSDSLLPLAMISIDRDVIQWIDAYLVRRDSGPLHIGRQNTGATLGVADPVVQQAFFLQYDAQLQSVADTFLNGQVKKPAYFAATDYFQALPPAGRFPIDAINGTNFTQIFFPQQMPVQLSLIPEDELPAILEESMTLPPIDLTLEGGTYANIPVLALAAVPRDRFDLLKSSLPDTPLSPALPQPGGIPPVGAPPPAWPGALKQLTYGFYVRRRSKPVFPDFAIATPPAPTTTIGSIAAPHLAHLPAPAPAASTSAAPAPRRIHAAVTTAPATTSAAPPARVMPPPATTSSATTTAAPAPRPRSQRTPRPTTTPGRRPPG